MRKIRLDCHSAYSYTVHAWFTDNGHGTAAKKSEDLLQQHALLAWLAAKPTQPVFTLSASLGTP